MSGKTRPRANPQNQSNPQQPGLVRRSLPLSISLVVPVYNPGPSLPALLQTLTSQRQVDEIILVDDASTVDVREMIQTCPDTRFRFFRFEVNSGPSVARNYGIDAANGEFIALLDADDFYLMLNLLERQRAFLLEHPDHIYVGSSFVKVKADGDFEQTFTLAETDTEIRWEALFSAPWLPSGCLMRRNSARFDPKQRGCEDNDFFSKLLGLGKGHNLGEIGFGYFMQGGLSSIHQSSNFINLLRTNQQNLHAIGIEASFEDILTLRGYMSGAMCSEAAFNVTKIVFDRFKAMSFCDQLSIAKIQHSIESRRHLFNASNKSGCPYRSEINAQMA
ncbi:MAG: glycosyltransferase family 2 protein [Alphaproteobacteria bacterium]|nr:glycosyltransferase family 2 protein [Alphaproteobacteria bacterium]